MGSFQVDGLEAHEQAMWGENAPSGVVAKADHGYSQCGFQLLPNLPAPAGSLSELRLPVWISVSPASPRHRPICCDSDILPSRLKGGTQGFLEIEPPHQMHPPRHELA